VPNTKFARVLLHVVGWLLFFSLVIAFTHNSEREEHLLQQIFSPWWLVFYFTYIFIFYLNTNLLMPEFYLQKKQAAYYSILVLILVGVFFLQPFDHLVHESRPPMPMGNPGPPPMNGGPRFDIVSIILFVMIWSMSSGLSVLKEWRMTLKKVSLAQADKAKAELAFLKAQINPHFLFNTLNNIYSLAVTKDDNTSFAVMKLSNIMRYLTDDATHDFVPLQHEIDCINDYIELQRLRLNKKSVVNFSVTGNINNKKIAPLILMTFVENVFKYGISNHELSPVSISVSADEKTINFFAENKIFPHQSRVDRTGIGINNTRRRLEHLYPNHHLLNIANENGIYSVILTLQV
jgi:hypothetical protein